MRRPTADVPSTTCTGRVQSWESNVTGFCVHCSSCRSDCQRRALLPPTNVNGMASPSAPALPVVARSCASRFCACVFNCALRAFGAVRGASTKGSSGSVDLVIEAASNAADR